MTILAPAFVCCLCTDALSAAADLRHSLGQSCVRRGQPHLSAISTGRPPCAYRPRAARRHPKLHEVLQCCRRLRGRIWEGFVPILLVTADPVPPPAWPAWNAARIPTCCALRGGRIARPGPGLVAHQGQPRTTGRQDRRGPSHQQTAAIGLPADRPGTGIGPAHPGRAFCRRRCRRCRTSNSRSIMAPAAASAATFTTFFGSTKNTSASMSPTPWATASRPVC